MSKLVKKSEKNCIFLACISWIINEMSPKPHKPTKKGPEGASRPPGSSLVELELDLDKNDPILCFVSLDVLIPTDWHTFCPHIFTVSKKIYEWRKIWAFCLSFEVLYLTCWRPKYSIIPIFFCPRWKEGGKKYVTLSTVTFLLVPSTKWGYFCLGSPLKWANSPRLVFMRFLPLFHDLFILRLRNF